VSAFGAYTSGSRHREKNFIVTSDGAERAEIIGRRPLGDRRDVNRSDVLDNLTRNFARQPEKESALDLIDRAAGLRRGTVHAVQGSLQPFEAQAAEGLATSSLPDRLVKHRMAGMLEERLPGLVARFRRHGKKITEIVHVGAAIAERIAAIARRRVGKYPDATAYWRKMAQSAAPKPQQSEAEKQSERRGRRR
jgi:hypothetical protein